jgi:hypothetical protein
LRRFVVLLALLVSLLGTLAGQASAQMPHDHFLTVPGTGTMVQVAPPRCALGETVQGAFLNFHLNVHTGTPATTGELTIAPDFC